MKTNQANFKETELGLIPDDWEIVEIGKYFDVITGKNLSQNERLEFGDFEIIGANGRIGYSHRYLADGEYVVTGRVGTLGEVYYRLGKFWPSDNLLLISGEKQSTRFLYYFLKTVDFQSLNVGSTQPLITQTSIKKLKVLIPSIPEQQKIAEVLGALDEKIELNRKLNKTLDSLAQAVFKKWFIDNADPNWETGPIADNSEEVARGFTTGYVEKSNLINLNQKVNRGEYLDETNFKYYPDDTVVPKNKFAKKGDILINSLGQGTLGRVHFYLEDTDNVVVDQHITIVRTGAAKLKPEYLYYYLTNCCDLESLITGSTGMLMLNISHIRNLEIQIPNIEIQNKFSTFAQSLNEKKSLNNKEIKTLSQIRDSLLPRLMSGKLRVR